MVHRLALDYEGIICGDGDLPAPNAWWQPPAPHVTPWEIINAAPNQSKPTPRDPHDPDTHRCDCPICAEIRKMQGDPMNHPHLQPVVNPYCKKNRAGCEGPGSPTQCSYCEGIYKYAPRKYARVRHTARVPHPWPGTEEPTVRIPGVGSWEDEPRSRAKTPKEAKVELLPNPIPEQFPDNDPMLRDRIDLNAAASDVLQPPSADITTDLSRQEKTVILSEPSEFVAPLLAQQHFSRESNGPAFRSPTSQLSAPGDGPQATGCPQGNTLRVLPSNSFAMSETTYPAPRGVPSILGAEPSGRG